MQETVLLVVCVLAMLSVVMSEGPLKFQPKTLNRHFNVIEEFTKYQRYGKGNTEIFELFKTILRQSGKMDNKVGNLENFEFHDCGGTVATIKEFSILPDPIIVPGDVTFKAEIDLKSSVLRSPILNADVTLQKKINGAYIKIPCIAQFGSCKYTDLCSMLDKVTQCPQYLLDNKIQCKCPYKKGVYSVNNGKLSFGEADLPAGDYQVKAVFNIKNQKAACFNVTFGIAY